MATPTSETVTISAPPSTDIWRKPSSPTPIERFSAPVSNLSFPRASIFKRARVTVSSDWTRQYDQGGILLTFNDDEGPSSVPPNETTSTNPYSSENPPKRWIKTGIEFENNTPYVSTVTCDRWADWSVLPSTGNSVTLEVERDNSSLWVYVVDGEKRTFVRKVTWAFEHPRGKIGVGLYACRPTKNGDGDEEKLEVKFDGWELVTELV